MIIEKLVRDKIAGFSKEKGDGRHFRMATVHEYPLLLGQKIIEEAAEVSKELATREIRDPPGSIANRAALIEELADCYEVLGTIANLYEINPQMIQSARAEKFDKKGGFKEGYVLQLEDDLS